MCESSENILRLDTCSVWNTAAVMFPVNILNKGAWFLHDEDNRDQNYSYMRKWSQQLLCPHTCSEGFNDPPPPFSFLSQLFFPESMISDSADVSKGMTSSELIQVNQEALNHTDSGTREQHLKSSVERQVLRAEKRKILSVFLFVIKVLIKWSKYHSNMTTAVWFLLNPTLNSSSSSMS